MIDIHSHILYGVDDGSKDEQMTLNMLKIAEQEGIRSIIATPHYITGVKEYSVSRQELYFNLVKKLVDINDVPISVYYGNEILLDQFVLENLKKGKCKTLNSTKYVLVEFPMTNIPPYSESEISKLVQNGYKPIIAHPERNYEFINHPERLDLFIEMGALTQINATSITGLVGKEPQQTANNILKRGQASFVASDSHTDRRRAPRLQKAYEEVASVLSKEATDILFKVNPENVINNKETIRLQPIQEKKSRLFSFISEYKSLLQKRKSMEV